MNLKETTIKKNYVFHGKVVTLRRDEAALPDGKRCTREVIEHPGAVCILCVQEGKVALVRQYRYACGEELLELPAGKLERGEDPKAAAVRELEEETGLIADPVKLLFAFYPAPGYSDERIYLYEAESVREGTSHPDEDEFLDFCYLPLEEAYAMIESGAIKDGKTIAALMYYKSHRSF